MSNITPEAANTGAEAARYGKGRRAALVSIVGNLLLAAAKFVLGWLTGSISVMADAAHSGSDMGTSIVVWIGLKAARRPADDKHPYGHGRAETIAALVVAVLLAVVGLDIAWQSIARMISPPEIGVNVGDVGLLVVAGIILLTALAKAWMGFYASRVGHEIDNRSLLADAWHHHSDALSSVLVAVALVLARWKIYGADAWLGLGVSLVVLYTAWVHLKSSISSLLGEQPDARLLQRIESLAAAVHGVQNVHAVTVHDYGRRKVASLHVRLLSDLPLEEAHRVATEVEHALAHELDIPALVHAEPAGESLPREHIDNIRGAVGRLLIEHPGIVSFHALAVRPEDHGLEVEFHIHVPPATSIDAAHALEHEITELLTRAFPELHVHVHIEPCRLGCDPCPGRCGVVVEESSAA